MCRNALTEYRFFWDLVFLRNAIFRRYFVAGGKAREIPLARAFSGSRASMVPFAGCIFWWFCALSVCSLLPPPFDICRRDWLADTHGCRHGGGATSAPAWTASRLWLLRLHGRAGLPRRLARAAHVVLRVYVGAVLLENSWGDCA